MEHQAQASLALSNPVPRADIMTALRVTVTIRCESPLDYTSNETFDAAPSFNDTDEICNDLKGHIDHCVEEIITRQDVEALNAVDAVNALVKRARYHIFISIYRKGRPWFQRHFASFQRKPIGIDRAQDLTVEMNRMIARYMKHHDPEFVWELPHFLAGLDPLRHQNARPVVNGPQNLCCVPSNFDDPGYSIDISVKTHDNGLSRNWTQEHMSHQSAPLTLALAEALMSDISGIARHTMSELDSSFQAMHKTCDGHEGSSGCKHFGAGAFELSVRIKNQLGPDYPHLHTCLASYRVLLPQDDEERFLSFVRNLERQIDDSRVRADMVLKDIDDLKVQVHELRGEDWDIQNPLTICIDSSKSINRDAMTRLVERLPFGIRHELNGRGVSALITVHKRGHLVLDALINGGKASRIWLLDLPGTSELDKTEIQDRVLTRIRGDLDMVLRNTVVPQDDDALSTLSITTPPTSLECALTAAQSFHTPDGSPGALSLDISKRLSRKPKLENLRLFVDGDLVDDSPEAITVGDAGDQNSREVTPSLADTDSVGLPDDAVTPNGSPQQAHFWPASNIHADNNRDLDNATTSDQSYFGEVTEAMMATYYQGEMIGVVKTPDALHRDQGKETASDESIAEDSLELALLGPKEGRRRVSDLLQLDDGSLSLAGPSSTKCRGNCPIGSAFYNLPNVDIASSSYDQESSVVVHADCDAQTDAGECGSEASTTCGQSPRPVGRRPFLLRRVVTPQLASNRSSIINVEGHIVQGQLDIEEHSTSGDDWSRFSFERGLDIV